MNKRTAAMPPQQPATPQAAGSQWLACPSCDRLFDLSGLQHGEKARCTRCGHLLSSCRHDGFVRVQAFAISGLIMLLIGCSFPFLSFQSRGLQSVMTLPRTIWALYHEGLWTLALLVGGFIILIPALLLMMMLMLGSALARGWRFQWQTPVARLIFRLQNWSMVEVFFIGVLVSLVKIAHMATVIIGTSFWAYGAFSLCFVLAMISLDRYQCWQRLGELQPVDGSQP